MAKTTFALSMTACLLLVLAGCAATNNEQRLPLPVTPPPASQSAGVIADTLNVTTLGRELVRYVNTSDEQRVQEVLNKNEPHQTTAWVNVTSNARIDFTPLGIANIPKQTHCRDFQLNIAVQGDKVSAFGTACRQQDGSWKVLS